MRYFRAKEAQRAHDAAFCLYVGTGVQYLVENTAAFIGNTKCLSDFAEYIGVKKRDTRSGDEIAMDVIRNLGLGVVNK